MAVKGIKYVHVWCQDHEQTTRFYRELLNLPEQAKQEGIAYGQADSVQIWPMAMGGGDEMARPGEVMLVLTSDDVQGDYERLTAEGVEFIVPPSNPYGTWEAHLRDPNGVWIILVEE
jgi:catechol 2,3-dioxygenase-like lactoylglutathione lyase family enzyme